MINDRYMQEDKQEFPKHACQYCGHDRKLVDTLVFDIFSWNEEKEEYEPCKYTDDFEHTGDEWCERCKKEWTGL